MKKLYSILMMSLILLVTCQRGLIVIHFKLNQNYIEKNYCENKSKPQLKCHGQCHLKKELQNTADDGLVKNSVYQTIEMVVPNDIFSFHFERPAYREIKNIPFHKEQFTAQTFIKKDLRPPVFII